MSGTLRFLFPFGIGFLSMSAGVSCAKNEDSSSGEGDEKKKKCKKLKSDEETKTELERCIAKCNQDMIPVKNALIEYSEQALAMSKVAALTVKRNVAYLQDSAPVEVKVGTIVGSGLFGVLLACRRGGAFRKLFYGIIGSTTAAAIIYPCESKVIAAEGYALTKEYSILAYKNIVNGAQQCPKKECKKEKAKKAAAAEKKNCGSSKEG